MNRYTCYCYYNVGSNKKLYTFVVKAKTRFGAIIRATKIVKRVGKWHYLNTFKEGE